MSPTHLGRYEITGSLGRGAMGVVYKARDPLIERTVAIKTVDCHGLSRDEVETFERRFFREAQSAGRLNHPNIVTIHDVGREGDLAYIAMELLQGQSLRTILDSGAVLPADRIADIAAQVADALAFAHANDVVHRDIKPANVMVLDNGMVKIADFGVALLPTGSLTQAGSVIGSPKYMSPEQVTGQAVDGRSDIFSLGAVLYEMLTGLPPFDGDDLAAILHQVINAEPPAPSSRRCNLHHGFDVVVARAMAKDPADRYRSAEEMAADLRRYRELRLPASAAPAPIPVPVPEPATAPADVAPPAISIAAPPPRWRKILALGTLAALVAAVALRPLWMPRHRPPPPAPAVPIPLQSSASAAPQAVKQVAKAADPAPALPPEAPKPPVPPKLMASLHFTVSPSGEIYVDHRRVGVSPPLREIKLPPGPHEIEIRHAQFAPYQERVILTTRKRTRIKYTFEPPRSAPAAAPSRKPSPAVNWPFGQTS